MNLCKNVHLEDGSCCKGAWQSEGNILCVETKVVNDWLYRTGETIRVDNKTYQIRCVEHFNIGDGYVLIVEEVSEPFAGGP